MIAAATMTLIPMDIEQELVNFNDYIRMGTEEEERSKGDSTREAYLWSVRLFLNFCKNRQPNTDLAREFLRSLEEKGNKPRSVNRHLWALKSYFRFKGDKLKLRGLTFDQHLPRVLSDEEWALLLAAAMKPFREKYATEWSRNRARLELALIYAYCSGPRASEVINLKLEDVDDKGFLRIMRKGRTEGWVPVEKPVIKAIRDYIKNRPGNGPYVFPGKTPGTHLHRRSAQAIVKAVCVRAGLPDVHVHTLRHTAGTQLIKRGATQRDIQEVLGHKSIQTTGIYTHLAREDLQKRLPQRFQEMNQGKLL